MQSDLLIYKEAKYPGNKFPVSTLFCLDLYRIKPPKKDYNKKSVTSAKNVFLLPWSPECGTDENLMVQYKPYFTKT